MARLNQTSDESLASQLQRGDMKALELLIDRYQMPLQRYVGYLGLDPENSQDVVQTSFIKLYQNIQSYDPARKFSSWLYRLTHNTAITFLRSKRFTIPWEEYLDNFIKHDPSDLLELDYDKSQVKTCLSQLPTHYRAPLALYYLEDKSYTEIMDILHLPMGTVAARINRAKKIMRTLCQKI